MSVIAGIDKFKEAMSGHEGEYVLIGGAACSILFDDAGVAFRLTRDLDIVVIVDESSPDFARAIWDFVKSGGYEAGRRRDGKCAYYRFILPSGSSASNEYPSEIELFARRPDFELENEDSWIAPLPFDEVVSSLSAIILDDGYYEFIKENVVMLQGVPLLSALHIIPLKMRAHIDNWRLHNEGKKVSEKNLAKHRSDIDRLSGLLAPEARLLLSGQLREDAKKFLEDFEEYAARETNRKRRVRLEGTLRYLREVYLNPES